MLLRLQITQLQLNIQQLGEKELMQKLHQSEILEQRNNSDTIEKDIVIICINFDFGFMHS